MKIVVFCNAGMSSGLIVNKMRKAADPGDEIQAYQSTKMSDYAGKADVVFLSPALRLQVDFCKKICDPLGIPCEFIDMRIYGMADGEALYRRAKELMENKKKE